MGLHPVDRALNLSTLSKSSLCSDLTPQHWDVTQPAARSPQPAARSTQHAAHKSMALHIGRPLIMYMVM